METIIVYVDDAAYAQQQLAPLEPAAARHWVLVACAPRMSHRISKWVSHRSRESWRAKWSDKLFGAISPWLRQRGDRVTELLAEGPPSELGERLQAEHPGSRIVDGRRPKQGPEELRPDAATPWRWSGTTMAIGMMLVLASD